MPSERFESLLADFLDGTLDDAGREALAAEIERDPAAARAFDEAVAFESLLAAAHRQAPAGRDKNITDAVLRREEASRPIPMTSWRARMVAAAAAALLVAVGVWAALGIRPQAPNRVLSGRVMVAGTETAAVPNGAQVTVVGSESARIRLADGSVASLEPKSVAVLRGPAGDVRQVVALASGAGSFEVEKAPNQFKVETPVGSVTVTGTRFSVELRPSDGKGEASAEQLRPAMAVAVAAGSVQVSYEERRETLSAGSSRLYVPEPKKEEPRKEEPKKEEPKKEEPRKEEPRKPEPRDGLTIGEKIVLSKTPAVATITGVVERYERGMLKLRVEKVEGQAEWARPKGEPGKVKLGESVSIAAEWEKGEKGDWRPVKAIVQVLERLKPGDRVVVEVYYNEHPRFSTLTLLARGEGERKKPDGDARKPEGEGKKPDGDAKKPRVERKGPPLPPGDGAEF